MKRWLSQHLPRLWYSSTPSWQQRLVLLILRPASWLFAIATALRRLAYRFGVFKTTCLPVPVIVVGNLTVGGTGKTSTVIHLVQELQSRGYHPGIITRGYGREGDQTTVRLIDAETVYTDAISDEALLMAQKTQCPVAMSRHRAAAGLTLIEKHQCDVILSDDGLQHYALSRNIEIALVDGERLLGNGLMLPAGPCREPISRLNQVDMILSKGRADPGNHLLAYGHSHAYSLCNPDMVKPLSDFACKLSQSIHAIAGIANPQHFFNMLHKADLKFTAHEFPDHHHFKKTELAFAANDIVLMTEKDAVKIKAHAIQHHWVVALTVSLPPIVIENILTRLSQLKEEVTNAR